MQTENETECKLGSGVNWQGALLQKRAQIMKCCKISNKQGLGLLTITCLGFSTVQS